MITDRTLIKKTSKATTKAVIPNTPRTLIGAQIRAETAGGAKRVLGTISTLSPPDRVITEAMPSTLARAIISTQPRKSEQSQIIISIFISL